MEVRYVNPRRHGTGAWVPTWLVERPEITPGAKLCYARLVQFYSDEKGYAWPGQAKLAECLGTNVRQVQRYIAELVGCRLIDTAKENGFDRSNRYRFPEHEWMSDSITTNPAPSSTTNPAQEENQLRESEKIKEIPSLSPLTSLIDELEKIVGKGRLRGATVAVASMVSRFGEERIRAALRHVTKLATAENPLVYLEAILTREAEASKPAPPPRENRRYTPEEEFEYRFGGLPREHPARVAAEIRLGRRRAGGTDAVELSVQVSPVPGQGGGAVPETGRSGSPPLREAVSALPERS